MQRLDFSGGRRHVLRVLCLGAHSDDIEIGCGGTIMELISRGRPIEVTWVVLSASGRRAAEARASARRFLRGARRSTIALSEFRDGHFPAQHGQIKEYFETLKSTLSPDLILTHQEADLHQDHRIAAELSWNTFRDHLILGYEIPKYDGDLGRPNLFVPMSESVQRKKIAMLMRGFASQRSRRWFTPDTFAALMRLRGVECNAGSGFAEAFYGRKLTL